MPGPGMSAPVLRAAGHSLLHVSQAYSPAALCACHVLCAMSFICFVALLFALACLLLCALCAFIYTLFAHYYALVLHVTYMC